MFARVNIRLKRWRKIYFGKSMSQRENSKRPAIDRRTGGRKKEGGTSEDRVRTVHKMGGWVGV